MTYTVRFRYFASYDTHTPLMRIPREGININAESINDARRKFFETDMVVNTLKGEYAGHFTIEKIYEASVQIPDTELSDEEAEA